MSLSTDGVARALNQVIGICKDAEAGYRQAAEGVEGPELTTFFNTHAQERAASPPSWPTRSCGWGASRPRAAACWAPCTGAGST